MLNVRARCAIPDRARARSPRLRPRDIASVVDEYVDAAAAAGLREVRLIHGRGKGVQRGIVQAALERHPLVVEFWDDPAVTSRRDHRPTPAATICASAGMRGESCRSVSTAVTGPAAGDSPCRRTGPRIDSLLLAVRRAARSGRQDRARSPTRRRSRECSSPAASSMTAYARGATANPPRPQPVHNLAHAPVPDPRRPRRSRTACRRVNGVAARDDERRSGRQALAAEQPSTTRRAGRASSRPWPRRRRSARSPASGRISASGDRGMSCQGSAIAES